MTGYEARKQRKRDTMLQTAMQLFERHGFKRVSVAEIAEAAGVSQVTIYNHFVNKERLVREVVKYFINTKIEEYSRILNSDLPYTQRLEKIIIDKSLLVGSFGGELIKAVYAENNEMLDEVLIGWSQLINDVTLPFLEEGKRLGYVDPDISSDAFVLYLRTLRRAFSTDTELQSTILGKPKLLLDIQKLMLYGLVRPAEDGFASAYSSPCDGECI